MTTGAVLLLTIVAVAVALATKPVHAIPSEQPRVLAAQLSTGGATSTLAITAQDPDSTITALDVRWSDGTRASVQLPCATTDYGGKTVVRTLTHRGAVTADGTTVRASARSCFQRVSPVTGAWTRVTAG